MQAEETISKRTTSSGSTPQLYAYRTEKGTRETSDGRRRGYTLYLPQADANLPPPPFPTVTLLHGFFRSGAYQSVNAGYLAQRGFIVLTPDMTRVLWLDNNRMRNVRDVLDHIRWLKARNDDSADSVCGLMDFHKLSLVGYSAGGGACLETLLAAAESELTIQSTVLLDGVPWWRTRRSASSFKPTKILSVRAEPSFCNEYAKVVRFLKSLSFPSEDIKVVGSGHCDGEGPTDLACYCLCGKKKTSYRHLYQLLLYSYLRDTLNVAEPGSSQARFHQVVEELQSSGSITYRQY